MTLVGRELKAEPDLRWEQRCLERLRRGEREAFAELYRVFAPRLYSQVLMPKLGHPQAAEDALSETFRAFLEHAGELEVGERSLLHWLARVAGNKAIDMHRRNARARRSLASFERLLQPLLAGSDPLAEYERDTTQVRAQHAVAAVLGALNPRYRRALELRFLEDQPRERCADLMEVKLGTFDVLLLRALRAFRKEWERAIGVGAVPLEEGARG
jgi:RNA polymerase sigma factor (sigma-70 family)